MLKKITSLALTALLFNLSVVTTTLAGPRTETDAQVATKIKLEIRKLGVGERARVRLRLKDETKAEGYVGETGEETVTVVNSKTMAATTVAYPQVRTVSGHGLSTRAKIVIGVGVALAVVAVAAVIAATSEVEFPNR
jgi:hypothetical protein